MNGDASPYRPEFVDALTALAKACREVEQAGYGCPILVGGAAIEFYVGSSMASGDFDLITSMSQPLRKALERQGFKPSLSNPFSAMIHEQSGIAVEAVSGMLFDGRADKERLLTVDLRVGKLVIPPIEDMIADRMGQDASAPRGVPAMKEQAIALYRLAEQLDLSYLDQRIRVGSVNTHTLQTLQDWVK
ncbi:hypothetical protein [Insolitispirillum peregrinum]|uniref:hypothetical protein n=1 Tax=Insolitispirillum peregrinum TaxID=80876 RepID=UPI003613D91C